MKKLILNFLLIITTLLTASAGDLRAHRGEVAGGYDFWFYTPSDTQGEKPLVIFLHGSSLCGRDLNRVKRYGTINAIERGRDLDAYVIAPQNPGGSWKPSKINELLEWAQEKYDVDADRIYVLGMSLGGYGTMDFVAAYPDKVAAAMALCGGSTSKNYEALASVPLWIVHGTADRAVPISASDKVAAGIRATGDDSRLLYQRVPGMNHGKPARYFYLQESYDWLFSHSLADEGRKVNRNNFSPSRLDNAYRDLGRKRSVVKEPEAPQVQLAQIEEPAFRPIALSPEQMLAKPAALNLVSDLTLPAADGEKKFNLRKASTGSQEQKQPETKAEKKVKSDSKASFGTPASLNADKQSQKGGHRKTTFKSRKSES